MSSNVISDLSAFDADFAPTSSALYPDALIDGEYEAMVESANLEHARNGQTICRWALLIAGGPGHKGRTLDYTSWLNNIESVCRFGGELKALGIPTDTWTSAERSFSRMLPGALRGMVGARIKFFKGHSVSPTTGKTYHNIRFVSGYLPGGGGNNFPRRKI
jgi:hypothetical protein